MVKALLAIVNTVLSWLPRSPFADLPQQIAGLPYLAYLNWFIPVGKIITLLTAWTAAILTYYLASVMLRWVKAIR